MLSHLQEIPVIVIGGPTAVGKTDLSIQLAQEMNGEIINGDSMQVYRHLDIGSGKITKEEMADIRHHLLDILEVEEEYDASRFKQEATVLIQEIWDKGKLPIIVGGTGLYLEGLLYNLEFGGKLSSQPEIRKSIEARAKQMGDLALWEELKSVDPSAAASIPYQNIRRTIRALEVIQATGQLFSEQKSQQEQLSNFNECLIFLDRPRAQLYDRINFRVYQMSESGLEQEARWLFDKAQGQILPSMKGIGYKEWWPYFKGTMSKEAVIAQIQQNSRRYAKRQLTWFRNRFKSVHWIDNSNETLAIESALSIVKQHVIKSEKD